MAAPTSIIRSSARRSSAARRWRAWWASISTIPTSGWFRRSYGKRKSPWTICATWSGKLKVKPKND
jgi:Penicillinase repressor.